MSLKGYIIVVYGSICMLWSWQNWKLASYFYFGSIPEMNVVMFSKSKSNPKIIFQNAVQTQKADIFLIKIQALVLG